jgi:hypothetical protein
MPKMTGDELLARLIGHSDASRMLVTGFADLSAVIRAVNDGRIFAYVAKQWEPDDFKIKVQRAAEHFRLAQELAHERRLLRDLMDNTPDGIWIRLFCFYRFFHKLDLTTQQDQHCHPLCCPGANALDDKVLLPFHSRKVQERHFHPFSPLL